MRVRVVLSCLILVLLTSLVSAAVKLETIGPLTDAGASEQLRSALQAQGHRVVAGDGAPVCDIWFVKGLPSGPKGELPGATYAGIPESTLIGVISFPKATTDFRGQGVKPGAYALRYVLHPADGNHLGISPIRDFLLMVPIADDKDPSARFKFEELAKLSAKATGTNHPAVLSLVTLEGQKQLPAVIENESAQTVLAAKVTSELSVALIVKGVGEH